MKHTKHIYQVFTGNDYQNKKSAFWKECEEKRIVNIIAIKKRKYTLVEWDYYTLTKYLQINGDWSSCNVQNKLIELRNNYIKKVDLPKKQQFYNIQQNIGSFYIKNEDINEILSKICNIFDEVLKSNCLEIVPIEKIKFPEKLKTLGINK